ncbi:MAG: O-antigen ligase family protein [Ferruginibacter sp.]
MKNTFIIKDTIENKISFYLLSCFLALFPFDYFYSQLVLGCFALHTVIHFKKERLQLLKATATWLPLLLYFVMLLSVLYSSNKKEGIDISGRQSAMLIMPILFAISNFSFAQYKIRLLQIFSYACTATILYLFADALYTIRYFSLPASNLFTAAFTNHNFSSPIALHATYMALYTGFSIAVLLYVFFNSSNQWLRIINGICLLILAAGLLQLASRAVLIAMIITVAAAVPLLVQGPKRWGLAGAVVLLSLAAGISAVKTNSFKQRYVSELKNDLLNAPVPNEILEPRILRWKLAVGLVAKSPLYGYGNGAEKDLLKEAYFRNKLYISYLRSFNAHSQYLAMLIRCGVIGLGVLLIVLAFAYLTAYREKDFLFLSFLILVSTVSVSENILDVNKGIFFYSFFLSFFLTVNNPLFGKATDEEPKPIGEYNP